MWNIDFYFQTKIGGWIESRFAHSIPPILEVKYGVAKIDSFVVKF